MGHGRTVTRIEPPSRKSEKVVALPYLQYVLERIAEHPIIRVDELLPWRVAPRLSQPLTQAA